ncbi:hypothetical protein PFTANZ_03489 [Plasmodium falciparum Tanzania (2000708)]|uniref:Uncharacterized protein n=1 Tax=Plasmodium falciparum Tanzania (2000708) TaxID=1036725 RepID=A0A024W6X7_PLAFA|nr:hypothetical protein PFTANZ_03489 [Plasmodium falciparum Tanzania (2000708)]
MNSIIQCCISFFDVIHLNRYHYLYAAYNQKLNFIKTCLIKKYSYISFLETQNKKIPKKLKKNK